MSACETLPAGLPLPLDQQSARDRHWRGRLQESIRDLRLLSGVNDDSLDDLWRSTVKDYTSLALTKQTDKRMAVWGVVKRLREMQSEEYVAGMWEGALEEQLAWRVADCTVSQRPPELQINPTWSWTSVQGTILTPGRSGRSQRKYTIRDHAGERIWFDLGEQGTRPGLPTKRSESASDMTRELDLSSERRRHSGATSRVGSQTENPGASDVVQTPRPPFTTRTSSPPRTEHVSASRQGTQYSIARQNSQITPDERREKEPALKTNKIAMQGFLHVGRLVHGRSRASWSFEIPHASNIADEIKAFPDLVPSPEHLDTVFVVLALTKRPSKKEIESTNEEIWYEGHGLLLQESSETWCFKRIGALEIRHLSYDTWEQLQVTSSSLPGSMLKTDTEPRKNFYID